jgi:hypothetical protein
MAPFLLELSALDCIEHPTRGGRIPGSEVVFGKLLAPGSASMPSGRFSISFLSSEILLRGRKQD